MEILKPTNADKENFRSVVPDDPRAEVKAMFGNLAAFVNGNMFMVCSDRISACSYPRMMGRRSKRSVGPAILDRKVVR